MSVTTISARILCSNPARFPAGLGTRSYRPNQHYPHSSGRPDGSGYLTGATTIVAGYSHRLALKSATISGATSTYTYDGDGHRASKTVGTTTTNYVYDPNQSLPVVLTDGTLTYVYGDGLAYAVDNSGNVQVYHTDGLGSVRVTTDAAGNVTQTYQTDEFGIPTQTQATSRQPFQFTGPQQDAESGFSYLRARYYDPTTGRFLSRDPLKGSIATPQTLNPYAYAGNNPTTLTDPSGKCLPACLVVGLYVVGVGISAIQTEQTFSDPNASLKAKMLSVGLLAASVDPEGGVVEGAGDVVIAGEAATEGAGQALASMANEALRSLPPELRRATIAVGQELLSQGHNVLGAPPRGAAFHAERQLYDAGIRGDIGISRQGGCAHRARRSSVRYPTLW